MEIENRKIKAYNNTIDELLALGNITTEEALAIKRIILERRRINKEKRDRARERYLSFYSDEEKRRQETMKEYEIDRWVRYREDGKKRSLIELIVILGMVLCGVDLEKFVYEDYGYIDEDLIVTPANENVTCIQLCSHLQNLADELSIASGRKSPTEVLAECQVKEAAARISKKSHQQNNDLFDLIATAEYKNRTKAPNQGNRDTKINNLER